MQIAHYACELQLQDGIETIDDFLGIDLVVVIEHDVLFGCWPSGVWRVGGRRNPAPRPFDMPFISLRLCARIVG
jgi:hypothetical protein